MASANHNIISAAWQYSLPSTILGFSIDKDGNSANGTESDKQKIYH
jgi:hypothetical protein